MKDQRRAPFIWQSLDALGLIRAAFDGKERSTAIAVYVAFTEAANAQRQREGSFSATRRQIAELAGATKHTVDKYAAAFVDLGLLDVAHRQVGDVNKPNLWTLLEVERGGPQDGPGVAQAVDQGGPANRTVTTQEELQEVRADVLEVWEHYVAAARPRVTKLYDGNAQNIAKWLNFGYTVEQFKLAIDGLLADEWRRQHGQRGISILWKTGPGTSSATDILEGFIDAGAELSSKTDPQANPRVRQAREDIRRWYASERTSNSLRATYQGAVRILQGLGLRYVRDEENRTVSIVAIDQGER
jgi:hypothetical protein